MTARAARACDRVLDALLVAFAAWTLSYQLCAALGLRAVWAVAGWALMTAAAVALARASRGEAPADPSDERPWAGSPRLPLIGAAAAGSAAAALFAIGDVPWIVVWPLWVAAAGCALLAVARRPAAPLAVAAERGELAVVALWTAGFALLALFLLNPSADDSYYVHLATWTGEHGRFPVRDVVHSAEVLPALYFPPVDAIQPLYGTIAYLTGLPAPDVVYLAAPPVFGAVCVLAIWRLLRAWQVTLLPLALTVACAFLLLDATGPKMFGPLSLGRIWQGKALFVSALVPLLFVLVHRYAAHPDRRGAALLVAGGIASVGLATSAMFVVPVLAAGAFAPLVPRRPRVALAGFAALAAYPVGAALFTAAVGGRTPDVYVDAQMIPTQLLGYVFGAGALALVAILAVLCGPALLRRGGPSVAGVALLVGLLFAPGVPLAIFHATDLGRVLWRLCWAVPVVALVGVLATQALPAVLPRVVRAVPAFVVLGLLAAAGQPIWSPAVGSSFSTSPRWKRQPLHVPTTEAILRRARPGDVVLAPKLVSQTLLVLSADVRPVISRGLYVAALAGRAGAHVPARRTLSRLVMAAQGERVRLPAVRELRRALERLGVDLACVPARARGERRILGRSGYGAWTRAGPLACHLPVQRVRAT